MAGLEGIDASSMEVIDALGGTRYVYDPADRIAKPVLKHTDFVPVARWSPEEGPSGARVVDHVRFGLPIGPRILTNARSDNLGSPAWKGLFGKRAHHALTAISYVVERNQAEEAFRIERADGGLIVVPSLAARRHYRFASTGNEYDDWGHVQLTGDSNAFVATVHDRFVIELDTKAKREAWMAPEATGKEALQELLAPAPPTRYVMVPIDKDVWTRKGDPEAVKPRGPPRHWDPASSGQAPAPTATKGASRPRQATL